MDRNKRNLPSLWLLCGFYCIWAQIPLVEACGHDDSTQQFAVEAKRIDWMDVMDSLNNVKVFTFCLKPNEQHKAFLQAANETGYKVHTIGMNEKLYLEEPHLPIIGVKLRLLREAFRPHRHDTNAIILYVSTWKTINKANIAKIYKNFKLSNLKVISSGPIDLDRAIDHELHESSAFRLITSEMFMGYAPWLYKMLQNNYHTFTSRLYLTLRKINFIVEPEIIQVYRDKAPKEKSTNLQQSLAPSRVQVDLQERKLPTIALVILITQAVPFMELFWKKIEQINFPKKKLHLYVYNTQRRHEAMAVEFVERLKSAYLSAVFEQSNETRRGHETALAFTQEKKSDYMFVVEADAHIDDPEVLNELLMCNREFIAPILETEVIDWSLSIYEKMAKTLHPQEYNSKIKYTIPGIWKVSFATSVYLIEKSAFPFINFNLPYSDPDWSMCESLNQAGIATFMTNQRQYGHLVDTEQFTTHQISPDLFMFFNNRKDWARKYLHPDYQNILKSNATAPQPCHEVYHIPLLSEAFCDDLTALFRENWSKQALFSVGLHNIWKTFLDGFVRPIQQKFFPSHYMVPARNLGSFVIRSSADDRVFLDPQHDKSLYSLTIALKDAGVDYEGGGIRFMRYNCSVTEMRKGWALIYPGHFTHLYEDLPVTKGTNYILRSLIDQVLQKRER